MRALICGLVVVVAAGIAGCGGGGGAPASLSTLPSSLIGTYQVRGLNLPQDQLQVTSAGDVLVSADSPSTRSSASTRIGSCDAQGVILLSGSWTWSGTSHSIDAPGSIAASGMLNLQATVTTGNLVGASTVTVSGTKMDDMETPPPPPDYPDDVDDGLVPPPPPPDYP